MTTELKLETGIWYGRTEVIDSYFTSPLKLGIPAAFGERRKIVLMMASAGILKGDTFDYHIRCGAGTKNLLTEQSYTKIFDTGEGGAERRQNIEVLEGASLYYRPCPVIPFKGSRFAGWTQVCLAADSEFAYGDIMAGGRVGMGECFLFSHYRNRVWVTVEGKPVWMDHCLLEPENMSLENLVFFDGFTHQGTIDYYGPKEKQEQLFSYRPENKEIRYGVSGAVKGIGIRILAGCAQDIERIFEEIEEKIGLRNE